MIEITDDHFARLIEDSIEEMPIEHMQAVQNVAIVYADEPTPEQREMLKLNCHETLFGLYEGVPLAKRQGMTHFGPDKITIFKNPMLAYVDTLDDLKAQVKHTLWHEIAHYFGLEHEHIHRLERGERSFE